MGSEQRRAGTRRSADTLNGSHGKWKNVRKTRFYLKTTLLRLRTRKTTEKKSTATKKIQRPKPGPSPGRHGCLLPSPSRRAFVGIGQVRFFVATQDAWERGAWMVGVFIIQQACRFARRPTSFLQSAPLPPPTVPKTRWPVQVTVDHWLRSAGDRDDFLFILLFRVCSRPCPVAHRVAGICPSVRQSRRQRPAAQSGWGEEGRDGPGKGAPPAGAPTPRMRKHHRMQPGVTTQKTQSGAPYPAGRGLGGDADEAPTRAKGLRR